MCANFIWQGKQHKIAQDKICMSKSAGGLGLRKIRDLREAAKYKLFQKFIDGKSLQARWIREKYLKNKNLWTAKVENRHSYTWKNILSCIENGKKIQKGNLRMAV